MSIIKSTVKSRNIKYTVGDAIHNFLIIEEMGYRTLNLKKPLRMIKVKCQKCGMEMISSAGKLNSRGKVCPCDKLPKYRSPVKSYLNEIHGYFKITQDLGIIKNLNMKKGRDHFVIASCLKCDKEHYGSYRVFKRLKRGCICSKYHGLKGSKKRIFNIYNHIIHRCTNKDCWKYEFYGAKGIDICNEWLEDREVFYNWSINNGYQDQLTIDRINNDLGYSPDNCRWTTKAVQAQNRKVCLPIDIVKKIKLLGREGISTSQIACQLNLSYAKVYYIKKGVYYSSIE